MLHVTTSTTSYPVVVARHALASLPDYLAELGLRGAIWLISDSTVYPRYGAAIEATLRETGWRIQSLVVPAGEASKSHTQLARIYDWMLGGNVERRDLVVALGGGVVGDLAGFAAASVLRGIAVVQVPTTLLSMVDAAVGGKTGINHSLGKNLIGAFHQPRLVLADTTTLDSLPPRELRAGWAEVIKHGVIRDAGLFDLLEAEGLRAQRGGTSFITQPSSPEGSEVIKRAVAVKVAVVSADEHEQGERITLNYGHTLGHALEALLGYGTLLHGEAVAIGMHAAARIAEQLGLFAPSLVQRQRQTLVAFGLPVDFPTGIATDELLALTLRDKKVAQQRVRWVLPTAIGTVVVRAEVPDAVVRGCVG